MKWPYANDRAADEHLLSMLTHLRLDQVPRGIHEPGGTPKSSVSFPAERFYDMRIDRDGTWFHEGRPIARMPLVKLFASVLRRETDGSYWLVTPVERGRIEVDDVPFVVVELSAEGAGSRQTVRFRSNLDEWVAIGPNHPLLLRKPPSAPDAATSVPVAPVPYVDIRSKLEGRLLRPVYYELVDLCEPHRQDGVTRYGVWSEGQFFALDEQPV